MDGSFRIGRLFGIPILIHYTFILVIPLFAWIIGSQISLTADMIKEIFLVPVDTSLMTEGFIPYLIGIIVALGLFAGVLCLLYTSPSPRDRQKSRMPSSA